MPATATKKPARPRPSATARARAESDNHRLDLVAQTLEAAQQDLASIGGTVGKGVRDLRRDATKMVRDARRDVDKMRGAIQRDLARLQKDLGAAASGKSPAGKRRKSRRAA